jgi:hypothetical protein
LQKCHKTKIFAVATLAQYGGHFQFVGAGRIRRSWTNALERPENGGMDKRGSFSKASAGGQLEQPSEVNNSKIAGPAVAFAAAAECRGPSPCTLSGNDEMRANTKTQKTEPIGAEESVRKWQKMIDWP